MVLSTLKLPSVGNDEQAPHRTPRPNHRDDGRGHVHPGHCAADRGEQEQIAKLLEDADRACAPGASRSTARRRKASAATARRRSSAPRCFAAAETRSEARFHELRGAGQSHDADAHAPLYPPSQRLLKEGREPRSRGRAEFHVSQFRPHSLVPARHAGKWPLESRIAFGRSRISSA
jgi:hypothetical protein